MNHHQPYHSGAFKMEPEADGEPHLLLAALVPQFYVKFQTQNLRPSHLITLRTEIDGWDKDVFGAYYQGEWVFFLERQKYLRSFKMKFVLDRSVWMDGADITINPDITENHFDESTIHFSSVPTRYMHGYDNLQTEHSKLQQDALPGNTDETIEYDVIIIGSGIGGGILADALSDNSKSVLVLEAGSLLYPSHITNLPGDWSRLADYHQVGHFNNEPGSNLLRGVQMNFGGRSIFWSGLIPRMNDWERNQWPSGIRAYFTSPEGYDRAEKLMRKQRTLGNFQKQLVTALGTAFTEYFVNDLPMSRHQPNLDQLGQLNNILETTTGTFSTAALLLESMSFNGTPGRDNLTVNLNHLVTRIETNNGRATAVTCRDLIANQQRQYRGKTIVLAAGSIETPRIAFNSALTDPNQKFGVGLTDHPAYFQSDRELSTASPYVGFDNHAKVRLFHRQATSSSHPYNVELLINPKYWNAMRADDDLWRADIGADQRTMANATFTFSSPLNDNNRIIFRGEGQKLGMLVQRSQVANAYEGEVRGLRNDLFNFLQANFDPNEGLGLGNEGTVHHAGGSMRLSGNNTGAVDENLRMEAYDNLYICDLSVFPMIPAANPALTLAVLALRLGDHLTA